MALSTIIMTICNIHNDYVWPSQWVFVTSQWFTCLQNEAVHPHNDFLWSLSYHIFTIKFDCDFDNDSIWLQNDSVWPHNDIVWPHNEFTCPYNDYFWLSQWLCYYHYISIWPWQWLCVIFPMTVYLHKDFGCPHNDCVPFTITVWPLQWFFVTLTMTLYDLSNDFVCLHKEAV